MNKDEIAVLDHHTDFTTICIFNRNTKKKVSEYGPFANDEEIMQFARERSIKISTKN